MSVLRLKGGKTPSIQKIVFELRYSYGWTYLDCCGRTINYIIKQHPEWILNSGAEPNPQNAPLLCIANGAVFNFSATSVNISLDAGLSKPISEINTFARQSDELVSIVISQLGVSEYVRVGLRVWFGVPGFSTTENVERWISSLGAYTINKGFLDAFNAEEIKAAGVAVVMSSKDRNYRVSFNGLEHHLEISAGQTDVAVQTKHMPVAQREQFFTPKLATVKRATTFSALIDVDAYLDDPDPVTLTAKDYIESTYKLIEANLTKALS